MLTPIETRTLAPLWVFDPVDLFAVSRRVGGLRPRPLGRLRLTVMARVESAVRIPLPEPLELVLCRNGGEYATFFGDVLRPDGSRRSRVLAPGRYDIRVESPFYQSLTLASLALPSSAPIDIPLAPGYLYPFPDDGPTLVRGTLRGVDGAGLAGAQVSLNGAASPPPYRTDDTGEWVLVLASVPASGSVTVHVEGLGAGPQNAALSPIVAGKTGVLRQTGLRGQVLRGDGRPVAGAQVSVPTLSLASTSRADGSWSLYFPDLNQPSGARRVLAVLPGGLILQQDVPIQTRATVVVPAFRSA